MATPDTSSRPDDTSPPDAGRPSGAFPADLDASGPQGLGVREQRIDRGGASGVLVSPEVRSDSGGPLPMTGMDRDSGAGASAGHDAGGREASWGAQAAMSADLRRRASPGTGGSLASGWQRLRQRDAARASLPGEHWVTFGVGLWLFTRHPGSPLGRLLSLAAGAALMWRAAGGRDGLLARVRQQRRSSAGMRREEPVSPSLTQGQPRPPTEIPAP